MACSDIQLNRVDIITFGVNLVPSVETFGIEIFSDFGLVVNSRRKGAGDNSRAGRWSESRNTRKDGGKDNAGGELHCCDDSGNNPKEGM